MLPTDHAKGRVVLLDHGIEQTIQVVRVWEKPDVRGERDPRLRKSAV